MVYETKSKSELPKNITWNLQDEGLITKFGKIGETTREMQRKIKIANGEEVDEKKPLLKDFLTDEDLPQWIRLCGEEERYMKLRSNPFILRTYSSKRNNPIEKIYSYNISIIIIIYSNNCVNTHLHNHWNHHPTSWSKCHTL